MHYLVPTILLILPTFSFATPAQSIDSLDLFAASPNSLGNIGPPIDPQFDIVDLVYEEPFLQQEELMTAAVMLMGATARNAVNTPIGRTVYWDHELPELEISFLPLSEGGTTEARFFMWGLYLGVLDEIHSKWWCSLNFTLQWRGQAVGSIMIAERTVPPPLSRADTLNSSNILQQRSLSNPPKRSTNESLDGDHFNLTVSSSLSEPTDDRAIIEILRAGEDLEPPDFIITLLQAILVLASSRPTAPFEEPVRVHPAAPFNHAKFEIMPVQPPRGRQPVSPYIIVDLIRQLPRIILLQLPRWTEMDFQIKMRGYLVATGKMSKA